MEKKRILVFLRVSTESQELEEQRKQMVDFCKDYGYDDMVFVEDRGASAIKQNEKYLAMLAEVRRHIEEKDIDAVAVWSVNRLARDEVVFAQMKKLMVDNKIQFLVRVPTLMLLNPDGSVNQGSELALSLFATMSSQEMKERQEKFKRTKHAYAKQGKYVGGNNKKLGYRVDEQGYFVPDEVDGAIIRTIFELYSTGDYSDWSLCKELEERGVLKRDGQPVCQSMVSKILGCESYTGKPDKDNHDRIYPPLVSEELFERCRAVRAGHKIEMRQGERIVLGSRIVRCSVCGASMTSNSRHYTCCRHSRGGGYVCPNDLKLRQCVVDDILWRVASACHMDYVFQLNENRIEELKEKIEVLDQKIKRVNEKISTADSKKSRIIDAYLEGLIDKKTRDLRLVKVGDEVRVLQGDLTGLNEAKNALLGLVESTEKDMGVGFDVLSANMPRFDDEKSKFEIIHKHILKLTGERMSYGHRDPRTSRPNAIKITVTAKRGTVMEYLYFPKYYEGHNLYIWSRGRWMPDMVYITDKKKKEDD